MRSLAGAGRVVAGRCRGDHRVAGQRPGTGRPTARGCRRTAGSERLVDDAHRSPWLKAPGLPRMLLDLAALAATSSACCGPMPDAARPGDRQQADRLADPGEAVVDGGG